VKKENEENKKLNYLISGGLGFIGGNLILKAFMSNKTYKVLDLLSGQDVGNYQSLTSQPNHSTFIHLAAFTNVRESIRQPKQCIGENLNSTLNCLNFALSRNSNFILTSSMGASKAMSPYSASKLACEACCTAFEASYGLKTTTLRLSNVYGPNSRHKNSVVAKFIKLCISNQDLEIYGSGEQTRDFIHVDDVCDTLLSNPKGSKIRVTSNTSTSINQLAELISETSYKLINFRPEIVKTKSIKGEILNNDCSTDIKPTVQLEQGIESTFKWFLKCRSKTKRLE